MTEDQITQKLLENRGLTSQKQILEFFHPPHPRDILSPFDSDPAIQLIKSHIKATHPIVIYGDYDVDGICSTAILWETLYAGYKNVVPHIPHRRDEGYGLTIKGIDHCLAQGARLIIAVDNGITAIDQVKYCRDHNCDIIIIDHHEIGDSLPGANVILHSTVTCASGLTWFFCRDFSRSYNLEPDPSHLELVALATICDLVPLMGINRSFAKHGLETLNQTRRLGLLALFEEAGLKANDQQLTAYHVGFVLGPRLNAMGRLEHALDSLRLLCTNDPVKAKKLAQVLNETNRARQQLTEESVAYAISQISQTTPNTLIVVSHETYDEGVIGLVAAKLVDKHYRPTIAISIGEKLSKGSARSIPGFHITDYLRTFSNLLLNVGGHAMAAGFTIETGKITEFTAAVSTPDIPPELLVKSRRVDCEIQLLAISYQLLARLKEFEPYGLGNPTPIFKTVGVTISNLRRIGQKSQHLKFTAGGLEAIYFNAPPAINDLLSNKVTVFYQIDQNTWNGRTQLQLIIKDVN